MNSSTEDVFMIEKPSKRSILKKGIPFNKPISKTRFSTYFVGNRITTFGNFPKGVSPKRGGIIPYVSIENEIIIDGKIYTENVPYFLFAIDSRRGEITDFGGQIFVRDSPLSECIREFQEESEGVFSSFPLCEQYMFDDIVCYNTQMMDIFVPFNFGIDPMYKNTIDDLINIRIKFRDKFETKFREYSRLCELGIFNPKLHHKLLSENSDIIWLSGEDTKKLFQEKHIVFEGFDYKVYDLVANFLVNDMDRIIGKL